MTRFLGKLGFVHRHLWRQEGLYRAAPLFGPAPLLGGLLAGGLWGCVQALGAMTYQPPRWATAQPGHAVWSTDQPQIVQPARQLPAVGTDGKLAGYEGGWRVTTNPIQISSTMDVDVKTTPLTAFSLVGSTVDVAQIIAGGPKVSLYVGLGRGFLAIRTAGVYTLTLRLERPAGPSADCLTRLGFGPHRVVSMLNVGFGNDVKTFEAPRFDLQPGLYRIGWAFSCWHDHEVVGPGRITLLVGHPGDPTPLPARADDIVRQERIGP